MTSDQETDKQPSKTKATQKAEIYADIQYGHDSNSFK